MSAPEKPEKPAGTHDARAVGRRKSSVARVYVTKGGSSRIVVNKRGFEDYFPKATDRYVALQPLVLLRAADRYDLKVNVRGGGTSGQAGAMRHGLARALALLEPESRTELKRKGLLTRDPRKVERKKAGLRGARRRFQFSKR